MAGSERSKRIIASIYSGAAKNLYDPIVVKGGFRLFGGRLNELAVDQGRRAVLHASGGVILDMPVGTAYFAAKVADRHAGLVVGCDIAEGMVRRSREVAEAESITNLKPVQADAHHLPFPDGTFVAVLCTNGLQVIPGLARTLGELVRVLSHGGRLFVSTLSLPAPFLVRQRRSRVPTIMLHGTEIADAIEAAGVIVESVRSVRLATLIEARK